MDFQDAIHLERIAKALHTKGDVGRAAVMIGAGMSANAVPRSGLSDARFPTWRTLGEAFIAGLYPTALSEGERRVALARANSTSGALRLAEEFEAAHGRAALDQLLIATIPDDIFDPGPLHHLLLKLPWSDVFTTNYDTLLERASHDVPYRRYDVVRAPFELATARRPRLVKLHGSFPTSGPFVVTEEDFRTYPVRSAALVNLAQQAFVENTFCLIGFSGDDPNFLRWSGWARDTLGSSVGQIYLCGILGLTSAQRKLLLDRHVVPLDLAPLFPIDEWSDESQRHAAATEWLLLALESARPPSLANWPIQTPRSGTPSLMPRLPALPRFPSESDLRREAAAPEFMEAPR